MNTLDKGPDLTDWFCPDGGAFSANALGVSDALHH
jgi:hypothetical protein